MRKAVDLLRTTLGSRARSPFSDRALRKPVDVEVVDVDRYGRLVGKVRLDGRDIKHQMVQVGHAWVHRE